MPLTMTKTQEDIIAKKALDKAVIAMARPYSAALEEYRASLTQKQSDAFELLKMKRECSGYDKCLKLAHFIPEFSSMVYIGQRANSNNILVLAFSKKRSQHDIYQSFNSIEAANTYITKWLSGFYIRQIEDIEKKQRNADLNSRVSEFVKEGDVFRSSWGYEQTNIDYYQVVAIKGKRTLILREIAGVITEQNRGDSGRRLPVVDEFINDELISRQVNINQWSATSEINVSVKIDNVSTASLKHKQADGSYASEYCSWGY